VLKGEFSPPIAFPESQNLRRVSIKLADDPFERGHVAAAMKKNGHDAVKVNDLIAIAPISEIRRDEMNTLVKMGSCNCGMDEARTQPRRGPPCVCGANSGHSLDRFWYHFHPKDLEPLKKSKPSILQAFIE
jgi:hypothetical protein